jgi:hypothetical protein
VRGLVFDFFFRLNILKNKKPATYSDCRLSMELLMGIEPMNLFITKDNTQLYMVQEESKSLDLCVVCRHLIIPSAHFAHGILTYPIHRVSWDVSWNVSK